MHKEPETTNDDLKDINQQSYANKADSNSDADEVNATPKQAAEVISESLTEPPVDEVHVNADSMVDSAQAEISLAEALQRVEQLQQKLTVEQEKALRIVAEAENSKRRALQEVDKIRKYAIESFAKALLPILDSCQSAKNAIPVEQAATIEGVALIEKNLLAVLADHQVQAIAPNVGDAFNPDQHQAMTTAPAVEGQPSNQIIEVFQRGFSIQDRLLRPALVVVTQ